MLGYLPFEQIWAADFEFDSKPGERPIPVCLVAWELRSGRKLRLWADQLGPWPPFPIGPESLFVAYYASAELGCFRALKWPMPARILDLYIEHRNSTNVLQQKGIKPIESGLLGALVARGLDSIGAVEKDEMRNLVMRGGPWSCDERETILDYCESDVSGLSRLLPAMLPQIDVPRALLRGRPAKLKLEPKFTAELLKARQTGDTARQKQRKKPAPTEFVKVPMLWVECLVEKRVGVNAYRVAHYVLHKAWRTNDPKVKLTNAALAAHGVDRKGKATALRQLREAGLISVAERPNRSPIVTVRFLEQ